MIYRAVIAFGVCSGLVACSNDRSMLASFAASPLNMPTAAATGTTASINPTAMPKKTMSDKVLAAMALERVTGMKPDPDRLQQ